MEVSMSRKVLSSAIPPIVLVAAVFWLVYAFRYQRKGASTDAEERKNQEKSTLSFQAVVAFTAVYYLLNRHTEIMMH